jgi:hypothetical protein
VEAAREEGRKRERKRKRGGGGEEEGGAGRREERTLSGKVDSNSTVGMREDEVGGIEVIMAISRM